MAFCSKCGAQINDNAQFCPKCGQPNKVAQQQQVNQFQRQPKEQPQEEKMKWWQKILFFLFGPVGLIAGLVYLIKKKDAMAKSAFLWGAIGTVCIALTNMNSGSKSDIEQAPKELMKEQVKESKTKNVEEKVKESITYESASAADMLSELEKNEMRAQKKYANKNLTISGYLGSMDSEGKYFTLEPSPYSTSFIKEVRCEIPKSKRETITNIIIEKEKGDHIVVKGKVQDMGEVIGYVVKVNDIN